MKKLTAVLLAVTLLLGLTGCGPQIQEEPGRSVLRAVILEVHPACLLVAPCEGESVPSDCSSIYVDAVHVESADPLQPGQLIEIVYDLLIPDATPAIIRTVYAIRPLDFHD